MHTKSHSTEVDSLTEPNPEYLLVEYQAAQNSAEHHDGLIWSITGVTWGASLILLGFLLENAANPQLKHIVVLVSILGVLLNIKVWAYTYQLAAIKNYKYNRCKAIETKLRLKQHSTLIYPKGRQKFLYSVVMILFIVIWIAVAVTALHASPANQAAQSSSVRTGWTGALCSTGGTEI
jgi:hypothetical protein